MSRKNPFKSFSKGSRSAPGSSSQPPLPSTSSESPRVPPINLQVPRDHDNTHSDRHGLPTEFYPGLIVASQAMPSMNRNSKKSESLMRRVFGRARRKLSPNRSRPGTSNLVEQSRPDTPFQLSANDAVLPSFPPARGEKIDNLHETSGSYATHDNGLSVHAQLEREGINVPPLSEHAIARSASSGSDRQDVIIGAIRLILQNATSALKFAPIPNLDAIPDLLLKWLDLYEIVGGNDKSLKGLDSDIRKAYDTILQPLALSTDRIPDEVIFFIKGFHSALEEQIKEVSTLNNRGPVKRTILATEIAPRISDVKACINDAINNFSTQATTLTLLRTIEASVQSELKRLGEVAAEHTYVKSKSECLPSTRDNIQESILGHLKDAKNRFVWLRGSPGTGKTAISMSIASTLEGEGTLAASFFWDKNRKGTGLDSLELFPSTLARQLALFSADFKVSLVKCLRRPEMRLFLKLSLEKQMRTLIIEPMNSLKRVLSGGSRRYAIILDGLDECGGPADLDSLMELVLLLCELPLPFAVLVSCRPESTVLSTWTRVQDQGLMIPCEDVDRIERDTFHTIRRMVDEGFHGFIEDSLWKPSDEDLDIFARGCRGLPIMASIRIRDAQFQIRYYGSTLKSEFEYFRNLNEAPMDLKSEYLRIMRRAYMPNSSSIRPHVAKNYREVVEILVAATWSDFDIDDISQLLGIAEDEVRSVLKPISSIVDLSSDNEQIVKFYHATAKEFITGDPIGEEQDKVFFIRDVKGYSIGLRLLQFVNDVIQKNEFGIPTELPLGDKKKWQLFQSKQIPRVVGNVLRHLFFHLDPSLLFSQDFNELQSEFEQLLTTNLLSFLSGNNGSLAWPTSQTNRLLVEWKSSVHNHKSIALVEEAFILARGLSLYPDPRHVYRSGLPFTPSSSRLYEFYGHLSDPVRVFSVSGEFSGGFIPLSEDARVAQEVMEATLTGLPKKFHERGREETNYEAEFAEHVVRNGIVTCAAISQNGSYVALGFGNGVIEVADIDDQCVISRFQCNPPKPPVWIEFICGGNVQIATEDTDGNITTLGPGTSMTKLGTLPSGCFPAVTAVSNDGSFIIRVPQNLGLVWYENMALLRFSGEPSVQLLASPSTPSPAQSPQSHSDLSIPQRYTIRFSPGSRYVGAYDTNHAFVWSTGSHKWIAQYRVQIFRTWIFNTGLEPPCLHDIPMPVLCNPALPLVPEDGATHPPSTGPDLGHDADESWLKHPFYDLSPSVGGSKYSVIDIYSSAMGRIPLTDTFQCIWFNGEDELRIPYDYAPTVRSRNSFSEKEAWYGDLMLKDDGRRDSDSIYFPRASKNGTRFLLQGKLKAPVVVDISQIV